MATELTIEVLRLQEDKLLLRFRTPQGLARTRTVAIWDTEDDELDALWLLVADQQYAEAREIAEFVYGEVPTGFVQLRPPLKLYPGKAYVANLDDATAVFRI